MKEITSYKAHSTMKNEGKILELLVDMALKQDHMVEELHTVKVELHAVKEDLRNVKSEIGKINSEMVKLTLQTSENTRAIFKMSEKVDQVVDHEKRLSKLERTVFK